MKRNLSIVLIMSIFLTFAACAEEPINDIETSTENAILTSLSNEDVNDFVWRNDEDVFIFNADSILYKTDIEFNSSSKIFEHTIDQCILTNDSIVYSIDDGDYSKVYKSDLHGKKSKILFQEKGWVYLLDITGHFLYYTNTDFNGDEGKTGLFELNLRSNKSRRITNDSDVYKISKQKNDLYYCSTDMHERSVLKVVNLKNGDITDALNIKNIMMLFPDNVLDNYLYYTNEEDRNAQYRIDSKGINNEKIFETGYEFLSPKIVVDGKIYYMTDKLLIRDIKTSKERELFESVLNSGGIMKIDQQIFFYGYYLDGKDHVTQIDIETDEKKQFRQ